MRNETKKLLFVGAGAESDPLLGSARFQVEQVASPEDVAAGLEGGRSVAAVVATESVPTAVVRGLRARFPGIAFLQGRRGEAALRTPGERERDVDEAMRLETLLVAGPAAELAGDGSDGGEATRNYTELLDILAEDADLARITSVVEREPGVGLRVLQIFNWAFFGLNRRFLSIPQAIELVGVEPLRSVVITARTFAAYEAGGGRGYSEEHVLSYAARLARLARRFAAPHGLGNDAFCAALLLDVGKLVIATRRQSESDRVLRHSFEFGTAPHLVEREVLGTSHAEVSARLLSLFGMPASIIECVALHHEPQRCEAARKLTAIVHAADALLSIATCGDPESVLDVGLLAAVGLEGELAAWRRAAAETEDAFPT